MSQLSLFENTREETPPRPPDLAYIRKTLRWVLRIVRDAQIMPWSASKTKSWEKQFPELADLLPAEEAAELIAEFKSELERLRSAD